MSKVIACCTTTFSTRDRCAGSAPCFEGAKVDEQLRRMFTLSRAHRFRTAYSEPFTGELKKAFNQGVSPCVKMLSVENPDELWAGRHLHPHHKLDFQKINRYVKLHSDISVWLLICLMPLNSPLCLYPIL